MQDKNGVEILSGQRILTDEAGWVGKVMRLGDYFKMSDAHKQAGLTEDSLILVDDKGGWSIEPNWGSCEVV